MSGSKASPPPADTIAAFDFDGTLTTRDSFFRFIAWQRPPLRLAADLAVTLPLLLRYAARLVGNETHKMALFARQFAGMPVELYQRRAAEFSRACVPGLIRLEALQKLKQHQAMGHQVVIVTASLPDWIAPWAADQGVTTVLGSEAEVCDGRLTGRLAGANCHGPEKIRRLLALYPQRASYTLVAYGDSTGDKDLLAAADQPFYRRFS